MERRKTVKTLRSQLWLERNLIAELVWTSSLEMRAVGDYMYIF